MRAFRKLTASVLALSLATSVFAPTEAGAVTVEVAKKCSGLMAKEFPPRAPGNPAAGSAKGNGQAARDFYKKCVDNDGNVDNAPAKNTK